MSAKSVLVVEDKELNRKVVRIVLESKGYEMLEATTAEETFRILNAKTPDLILMDIALPGGVDGEDLTKQIKTDPPMAACSHPCLDRGGNEGRPGTVN